MIHLRIKVELTLLGPILTQSTSAGDFGIDAMMARTTDGKPYLPYSLVRGKLRQALEELQGVLSSDDAKKLAAFLPHGFGPRNHDEDFHDQRGTVFFSDFVHPQQKPVGETLSRIQMDPDTGATKKRMLMVIDAPFKSGESATFEGEIRAVCKDYEAAKATLECLRAGLGWLTHLGAERTVGFGRVESVAITKINVTELTPLDDALFRQVQPAFESLAPTTSAVQRRACSAVAKNSAPRHLLRIRPNGLFCFGGNTKHSNIFESESIIPGNTLLGALASTYCMATGSTSNAVAPVAGRPWQALAKAFGKVRFTHAFPVAKGSCERPVVWPLSFAAAEPWHDIPEQLFDVALCTRPRMIPQGEGFRPPVFASDWKGHVVTKKLERDFGWKEPRKELRVRTAIDSEKLRAEDEKLFAYEMIDPAEHDWLAVLDLSRIEDETERATVLAEIRQLVEPGLGPLGKTKVDAKITFESFDKLQAAAASNTNPVQGDLWIVTLQTPAILCSRSDLAWSETSPAEQLLAGYRRVFTEISGGDLRLVRCFAKQSLSSVRFAGRLPRDSSGNYYPFLLTEEGSTFVLQANGDIGKSRARIEDWLARGVPFASSLAQDIHPDFDPEADDAWKHCPYLARFGFGEILVNPPWFWGEESKAKVLLDSPS